MTRRRAASPNRVAWEHKPAAPATIVDHGSDLAAEWPTDEREGDGIDKLWVEAADDNPFTSQMGKVASRFGRKRACGMSDWPVEGDIVYEPEQTSDAMSDALRTALEQIVVPARAGLCLGCREELTLDGDFCSACAVLNRDYELRQAAANAASRWLPVGELEPCFPQK